MKLHLLRPVLALLFALSTAASSAQSADELNAAAAQLSKEIEVAKSKGVGTKPYEDALKSITESIAAGTADGAAAAQLKSRITSISDGLRRQLAQMTALKTRPRASGPIRARGGGGGGEGSDSAPVTAADFNMNSFIYTVRGTGIAKDVSPEFVEQVKREILRIPRSLLAQLQSAGCRICIAPRLADKLPDYRNTRPRGWEEGMTGKNVDGLFDGTDVIVCEYSSDVNDDQELVKSNRCGYLVRHESGHAFDHYWGGLSDQPDLKHAYYLELAHMDPNLKDDELAYFAQKSDAGRSECFAELFAIMMGGGASKNIDSHLPPIFPEWSKMIRAKLGF